MQELWKPVPGYEGIYEVSNLGSIKSLERKVMFKCGKRFYTQNESIKKPTLDENGYLYVNLYRDSKKKSFKLHQIVAMAFLDHKPSGVNVVVDHIDNNRLNNHLSNLQVITQRENSTKDKGKVCTGAYKYTNYDGYFSSIRINGKSVYLGSFKTEYEAAKAYQNKLKEIENGK